MLSFKQIALSVGFDACGIARAEALTEDAEFLKEWLNEGKQGDMHYLERNFGKRTDPRLLVPGCKSVLVVLMNYYPQQLQNPLSPQIAKYAYSAIDYHEVLKNKLSELEHQICKVYGSESINTLVQHSFVDSAPVLERRWAERAGLGWIGKHTQLIHQGAGSYVYIGVLMLNIETEYDSPVQSRCGSCKRCMDACPTNALTEGSMDARRCLSYLTIESKSPITGEFKTTLSGNALGCDICADVCPWNIKWCRPHSHDELSPAENMLEWDNEKWRHLTKNEFDQAFSKSAIKRAGYEKLKQNIDIIESSPIIE